MMKPIPSGTHNSASFASDKEPIEQWEQLLSCRWLIVFDVAFCTLLIALFFS